MKIELNKQLDKEIYLDFKDLVMAGADFGGKIRKDHPGINQDNYRKYIDDFYFTNEKELSEKLEQINKILVEKQDMFWLAVKNIFGEDLSEKNYKGYLSIFNCNPRWTESGTFQVYYKKDGLDMLEVAFHESLHFAFFDFCNAKLPEIAKKYRVNSGPLWELSEIFNVIILNQPEFIEITEREEKLFYPALADKLEKIKLIWAKKLDMKKFIEESLLFLGAK